mgnify:FL=1
MKILMVNKFLYPRGGAESYMLSIGRYLESSGHEVQYFGMYDEKNTVGNEAGEYTANMDFHTGSLKKLFYPFKIIYSFEARRKIGRVLDSMKPDVVHLNNINFQLTPSVIDAAYKRKIPVVWTLHDCQLVCPDHLMYNSDRQTVCEKCVGGSKMHCIKNRCIHSSLAKSIIGTAEAYLYKHKKTYGRVGAFIAPSRFLYGKLLKDNEKLFSGRTYVMHNFVNKRKLQEGAKNSFGFNYIAFAGRLSTEKGTGVLAQTARLLPDVRFVVMGDGPEKKRLEGIDNVTLTGFVSGSELDSCLAFADAIAVPSVCYENCPMSILEARMLSVPAVTMNMGGMAELVENGVTGVLSASADPCDFAAAVSDILSDRKRLDEMKENCRKASQGDMDIAGYCDRLIKIYESLKEGAKNA